MSPTSFAAALLATALVTDAALARGAPQSVPPAPPATESFYGPLVDCTGGLAVTVAPGEGYSRTG